MVNIIINFVIETWGKLDKDNIMLISIDTINCNTVIKFLVKFVNDVYYTMNFVIEYDQGEFENLKIESDMTYSNENLKYNVSANKKSFNNCNIFKSILLTYKTKIEKLFNYIFDQNNYFDDIDNKKKLKEENKK